jgi:DNA end-binding protein Ku
MRAIWKGAVSFGLVSVPVKLYSATESHDISFRQVHAKDGGRIKYQRICSLDGEEVAYADIAKGYETEDGEMVILDDDDMAELPANSSREISVEKFVPSDQIDPIMLDKPYFLEPEKSGLKPYALLRDALRESDRVAVVTVSLRTRMTPAVLRVRDDVLVMQTLLWPDEVRAADFGSLQDVEKPKKQELDMARMLLDTLAGDYDPNEFEDDYAEAVQALVQAKLEGGEVKRTKEEAPQAGEVVDLLAALQKSVAAAKTARGEDDAEADEPAKKKASKKSASKKSDKKPAKKAAAKKTGKKTASKKTAARKSA